MHCSPYKEKYLLNIIIFKCFAKLQDYHISSSYENPIKQKKQYLFAEDIKQIDLPLILHDNIDKINLNYRGLYL